MGRRNKAREDAILREARASMAARDADIPAEQSPIECVAGALEGCGWKADEVLVPEQCLLVTIGEQQYHVTIQEVL